MADLDEGEDDKDGEQTPSDGTSLNLCSSGSLVGVLLGFGVSKQVEGEVVKRAIGWLEALVTAAWDGVPATETECGCGTMVRGELRSVPAEVLPLWG